MALAGQVGLARNTVQARLARFEKHGVLARIERRIEPAALGYALTAFITATVTQQLLDEVAAALADIPEVLEATGLSGAADLLVRVAARDADDPYRSPASSSPGQEDQQGSKAGSGRSGVASPALTARSSWCTASSSIRVTRKSPRLMVPATPSGAE